MEFTCSEDLSKALVNVLNARNADDCAIQSDQPDNEIRDDFVHSLIQVAPQIV
jgi:hypothetical protein